MSVSIIQKGTKNALETGRTFATLFADMDLRLRLLGARSEDEFKQLMWEHMRELADEQCDGNAGRKLSGDSAEAIDKDDEIASIVSDLNHVFVYCYSLRFIYRNDTKGRKSRSFFPEIDSTFSGESQ